MEEISKNIQLVACFLKLLSCYKMKKIRPKECERLSIHGKV